MNRDSQLAVYMFRLSLPEVKHCFVNAFFWLELQNHVCGQILEVHTERGLIAFFTFLFLLFLGGGVVPLKFNPCNPIHVLQFFFFNYFLPSFKDVREGWRWEMYIHGKVAGYCWKQLPCKFWLNESISCSEASQQLLYTMDFLLYMMNW